MITSSLSLAHTATKRPSDPSINFCYCPKTRIFAAALRVAARQGVRALTIANIGVEAKRAPGTVGRYHIDEFVKHVVDHCFSPLVALFERQLAPSAAPGSIEQAIDQLFLTDPDVPALILQAQALAAASKNLKERFKRGRTFAEQAIIKIEIGRGHRPERAVEAIRYYQSSAGQILG